MSSKLQGLRVDDVDIGRRNGQNQTVRLGDVFGDEVSRLLLDIGGLVANRDLGLKVRFPSCHVLIRIHIALQMQ